MTIEERGEVKEKREIERCRDEKMEIGRKIDVENLSIYQYYSITLLQYNNIIV